MPSCLRVLFCFPFPTLNWIVFRYGLFLNCTVKSAYIYIKPIFICSRIEHCGYNSNLDWNIVQYKTVSQSYVMASVFEALFNGGWLHLILALQFMSPDIEWAHGSLNKELDGNEMVIWLELDVHDRYINMWNLTTG